jgi:hypothetical protein
MENSSPMLESSPPSLGILSPEMVEAQPSGGLDLNDPSSEVLAARPERAPAAFIMS